VKAWKCEEAPERFGAYFVLPYEMEKKPTKPIPVFASEDEEREFWLLHDSTEYVHWNQATKASFPNVKSTAQTHSPVVGTTPQK
jgi:hypothetical protein